jgi:hypothetical protein
VIHSSSVAVSRQHRRAKTEQLAIGLLKRGFLGWLRGECGHCSMARVPTIGKADSKRPNRERECLVGERTRIVNRMKGTLARLGIRNFRPTLRGPAPAKASSGGASRSAAHAGGLAATPECLGRAAARHRTAGLCRQPNQGDRGRASETTRTGAMRAVHTPWCGCWLGSSESALKQQICSSMRCSRGGCVIEKRWRASPV